MANAPLRLRPGPFPGSRPPGPEAWTALALSPWLAALAAAGVFWPLACPLAALASLALAKPAPGSRRPWAGTALNALLAAVLLGPWAGPLPLAAAGLAVAALTAKTRLFRHPFLPAALIGLLAGLPRTPALGPLPWPWLLALLPAALAALLTGRQRPLGALIPILAWAPWAALAPALGLARPDWSWGLVWLTLPFHLGREFWPSRKAWPGAALVTLAGLAPWSMLPGLAALSLIEATLSLKSRARARKAAALAPAGPPPDGDPDLVAIRLCGREGPSRAVAYQGPPGCRLAAALDGGPEDCPEGCLTLGDCAAGCPNGAIKPAGPGLPPKIDKARCRGCGACLTACPKGLMTLRPRDASFVVACRGSAKLKDMDALCPAGCLKCGRCRKACPAGAIARLGLLAPPAVSDETCQNSRPGCGLACRPACPRGLPGPATGRF